MHWPGIALHNLTGGTTRARFAFPAAAAARRSRAAALLLIGALWALPLGAQTASSGSIQGRVSNAATGAFLPNVAVSIDGSVRTAVTDARGEFVLSNIPPGPVRVRASYLGLEDKVEAVTVVAGQSVARDFVLDRRGADRDTVRMEAVNVVADREISAQTLALNEQRQAPSIKNVVAFDEYPTGFDDTLTYFLRFIPGVSGTSVRGLPGDQGIITIDGTEVTGVLTGQTRAAGLNVVPVNNISRIEVTKVPTPDMPANLGGGINVISRSGFERSKPQLTYNLFSGWYTDLGTSFKKMPGMLPGLDSRNLMPSLELNYLRPINKSLAITANAAWNDTYRAQIGTISTWDLTRLYMTNINSTWTPVRLRTKSGRIGVDWKIGPKDILSASVQYRNRDSVQYEQGLRVDFNAGATGDRNSVTGAAAGNGAITQTQSPLRLNSNTRQALVKYEHRGDVWRLNASLSDSDSRSFYGNTNNGWFYVMNTAISGLVINATGLNTSGDSVEKTRPQSYTVVDRTGRAVDPRDGNLMTLTSATSTYPAYRSNKSEFKVDLGRDWHAAIPLSVKVGGMFQPFKSKGSNAGAYTWNFRPTGTAADRIAGQYGIVDEAYSASGPIWAGDRVRWISPLLTYRLFQQRPEYFVPDIATSYTTQVNGSRKLAEDITAGFLRLDARLLKNRLWLVGGVRYEQTDDEGWGPLNDPTAQYFKDARGNVMRNAAGQPTLITTDPVQRALLRYTERGVYVKRTYSGFYPSLNANFNLRDDLMLRFGFAQSVGRPPITNIVPSVSLPDATATSGTITVTNTGLKPWSANSYDVSLESYLLKNVTASISMFQKDIKGFFVATSTAATPELLDQYGVVGGDAAGVYTIATVRNGGDAQLRGIELAYKQNLTFLPDWARGFQVFANWTRRTVTGPNKGDFSGFFPSNLSWGVNLTRGRFAAKFSSTYREEIRGNLIAASATIPANTYDWSRASLSYQASVQFRLTRRIELYGTLVDFNNRYNLLGLRRHNENTPDWAADRQTLKTGPKAVVGVRGEY
jgi:TonB-dependent receptor